MKGDVADVGRVADDGENDVGLRSDGRGRDGPLGAQIEEGLGFGLGSSEDSESVAGFE